MGLVFRRRIGQRIQIGNSIVAVRFANDRFVELYVDAPLRVYVRCLDAGPIPGEPPLPPLEEQPSDHRKLNRNQRRRLAQKRKEEEAAAARPKGFRFAAGDR
jgi:hypothetical protein